jgi:hypothetical protein
VLRLARRADGWRTTCTRCDVHLCEACELLGRHDWRPDHVRLRKMGAAAAAPPPLYNFGEQRGSPAPPAMLHFTSGRNLFDATQPVAADGGNPFQPRAGGPPSMGAFMLHPSSGRSLFEPAAPSAPAPPHMFGMAHFTSGRAGFACAAPPPGGPPPPSSSS